MTSTTAGRWCVNRSTSSTARWRPPQDGLQDVSIMMHQAGFMATAVDKAAAKVAEPDPNGRCLIDDDPSHIGWVAASPAWKPRCCADHLRQGGARTDDAGHLAGPDGHSRGGGVAADRNRRRRRRRRSGIHLPLRAAGRHLRRHSGGVPEHDRAVRAGARSSRTTHRPRRRKPRSSGRSPLWATELCTAVRAISGRPRCGRSCSIPTSSSSGTSSARRRRRPVTRVWSLERPCRCGDDVRVG